MALKEKKKKSVAKGNRLRNPEKEILCNKLLTAVGSISERIHAVHAEVTKRGSQKILYGNGKVVNFATISYLAKQMVTNQQFTADNALSQDREDTQKLAGEMSEKNVLSNLPVDLSTPFDELIEKLENNAHICYNVGRLLLRQANTLKLMKHSALAGSGDVFKQLSDYLDSQNLSIDEIEKEGSDSFVNVPSIG